MGKMNDDERFKNVSYQRTDIKKTFARERKRLADEEARRAEAAKETAKTVIPIEKRKAKAS